MTAKQFHRRRSFRLAGVGCGWGTSARPSTVAFKTSEWGDSGLPIIRIQNFRDKNAEFNYFDGEVEDRHIVNEGDLLFAWSGTPGTSFGAFVWPGPSGVLNQHIFKLTPDHSRVNNEFLYHAINLNLDDYVAVAQGGGGLAHITRSQFLDSEVILAPLKEQSRIVKAITANQKAMDEQESVIDQNIQRTRAAEAGVAGAGGGGKAGRSGRERRLIKGASGGEPCGTRPVSRRAKGETEGPERYWHGEENDKPDSAKARRYTRFSPNLGRCRCRNSSKSRATARRSRTRSRPFIGCSTSPSNRRRLPPSAGDDPERIRLKAVKG